MNLPDVLIDHPDGEIRVKGSRISLFNLVRYFERGFSPREIVEDLDSLSVGQVEQVLDFYREQRRDVDDYVAAEQAAIDRYRTDISPGPSIEDLQQRLEAKKASVK